MRILITNNTLGFRAGTELYVRDIAFRLRDLGHEPVCFAMQQGEVAKELRDGGIQVVSSLSQAQGPFDLIHGHHRLETTLAAMAFPKTPVLSICHGPKAWQESPAFLPNIVQHAAVDEACRDRVVEAGIPRENIVLLLNFADTQRFRARPPLPPRPRNALVFSNSANDSNHLPVIRKACEALDITLDVAGLASGHVAEKPEELLPRYDLVFAKARAAIEAMAVGCAVIQCDYFGAGWMVTSERFDTLRPLNFGYKSMTQPITAEHLTEQIGCYNAEDAAAVSKRIRTEASLDAYMPGLLTLYERVAATQVPEFDPWEAGAQFLGDLTADAKDAQNRLPWLEESLQRMLGSEHILRSEIQQANDHLRAVDGDRDALRAEIQQIIDHLRSEELTLQVERKKIANLRQKKSALENKNQVLKDKNRGLKECVDSLRRNRLPWWKRLL